MLCSPSPSEWVPFLPRLWLMAPGSSTQSQGPLPPFAHRADQSVRWVGSLWVTGTSGFIAGNGHQPPRHTTGQKVDQHNGLWSTASSWPTHPQPTLVGQPSRSLPVFLACILRCLSTFFSHICDCGAAFSFFGLVGTAAQVCLAKSLCEGLNPIPVVGVFSPL